jgi:serine/threonine protein kinase
MHREVASLQVLSSAGGAVPAVLDHNTESFLDVSVELFVVMDFIPGLTLRELVDTEGPMPLPLATDVVLSICETIEIAHTYPVIHRDLKPENIIVRDLSKKDVVIVDYGLSFNEDSSNVTKTTETFRNRFLDLPETNTPGGNRRDLRSDVTAACAIFYYLLTGHVPGQLQDAEGLPPHRRPKFSLQDSLGRSPCIEQLEVLFNRGFAPSIASRFQTIEELHQRIRLVEADTDSAEPEDPALVAGRAAATLRQRDRLTQIREFREAAMGLLEAIKEFTTRYEAELKGFVFRSEWLPEVTVEMPAGIDRVSNRTLRLILKPEHHVYFREAEYEIGSRGEQCVVLRQKRAKDGDEQKDWVVEKHEEIQWYDVSTQPDLDSVTRGVKAWLNDSLLELTDVIVARAIT